MATHQTAKTQFTPPQNNVSFAYRRFGNPSSKVPLLFLTHLRGTMDMWDPLLVNSIAKYREVILFDDAGWGQSSGSVARTLKEMGDNIIRFLSLINVKQVDVLGFSWGGMLAPYIALNGPPGLARKLILAGATASIGEEIAPHPKARAEKIGALAAGPKVGLKEFKTLFFYPSETSLKEAERWWARIHERTVETCGEERSELVSHGYKDGGKGMKAIFAAMAKFHDPAERHNGTYDRLGEIKIPVFIAQGKDDFMIPSHNSYVMQQKLPNAYLKIFPDSGHGFLYQFAEEFAEDVRRFLDGRDAKL